MDHIVRALPYPVARKTEEIAGLIRTHAVCGIGGEAGSGKSTVVPLVAAAECRGRVIVVQPRRLAAIAVCRRLNELCEKTVGRIAGYAVRHERDERKSDRVLCVTTGVYLRLLADDPALKGTAAVVIDEIHERGLESDLSWLLSVSVLELYRPDLRLVVMSASVGEELLAKAGIEGYGWITVQGRLFPVTIEYRAPVREKDDAACWAAGIGEACERTDGDILVFLPGEREIRTVAGLLDSRKSRGFQVHELFGRMNPREQKLVLQRSGSGRRIILATNVAQTSLTIEGITAVVDSGLEKTYYKYPGEAASQLITRRISESSALQRAGRAGRLGPGLCLRLWNQGERLDPEDVPALYREDNARAVLELARWGDLRPGQYKWLSPPDPGFYDSAIALLRSIGILDPDGRLTAKGKVCSDSSLAPDFASAVFDSRTALQKTSLLLAGLVLDERDPKYAADDLSTVSPSAVLRDGRLASTAGKEARVFGFTLEESAACDFDVDAIARNFPLAIGLADRDNVYKLAGGPALRLASVARSSGAIVVFRGDHKTAVGVIHQYLSLDPRLVRPALKAAALTEEDLEYDRERKAFSAVRRERFGSLVLSETRIPKASLSDFAAAFYRLLEKEGPQILRWDDRSSLLRQRIACVKAADTDDAKVIEAVKALYGDSLASPEQVRPEDVLFSMVPRPLRREIRELDEKRFRLSNGRFARIRYEKDGRIVVSAKLQDFFGVTKNPVVVGVTAIAELLSPAGRPVQITSDLAGFWKTSYQAVRKEMAGRYPKHEWPIDPLDLPGYRVMDK